MTQNLYDEIPEPARPLATPDRVLTIGAHPDDAEFGAGATLSRWATDGCEVTIVVVTDGSKGSWDPEEDQGALIRRRKDEQHAAATVLGASDVMFLGHIDGELEYSTALRTELAELVRRVRPTVVLTHDPWQRYQMHPDHRATGLAAVDAVVSAREPLAPSPAGLPHHRPDAVLLWSADEPDHVESTDDRWFDKKIEALLCHSSQSVTTMGDAAASSELRDQFATRIRAWMEQSGAAFGVPLGESFKRLTP